MTDRPQLAPLAGAHPGGGGEDARRPGRTLRYARRWASPATPVALGYGLVGGLWILLSDRLTARLPEASTQTLQTVKGWLFVAVTSLLLWIVLHGYWRARSRAEARLLQTHERLDALFESVRGVVFRLERHPTSGEWRFTFAGPGTEELLGCPPEELAAPPLGRPFADVVHPEDRASVLRRLRSVARVTAPLCLDLRLATAAGETRDAWLKAVPILGEGGVVRAFEGLVTDTSRVRQLERQLLHAQRLEPLGQLAAGIAHDFNQVLTSVQGYQELARLELDRGPEDPQAVQRCLEEVRAAVERGTSLTRQLLAFGRRDPLPRTETVDLRRFLQGAPGLLRPFLGSRIAVQCQTPEECLPVDVDARQLEQVLVNLAVNARDAMPEGGELALHCRRAELENPLAEGAGDLPPGSFARLEVADHGSGMDDATLDRIFEPFFTTKPEGVGTGLGLPVVYGIVERHGGSVSVRSRPGEGTTFTLHLPLSSEEEAAAGSPVPGWTPEIRSSSQ